MLFAAWDSQTSSGTLSLFVRMVVCFIQQPVKNALPPEDVYEIMTDESTEPVVSQQLERDKSV